MIDLSDTADQARFRADLRAWLAQNVPTEPTPGPLDARHAFLIEWHRRLYAAGYVGLSMPKHYGGQGLGPIEEAIFSQELSRVDGPPGPVNGYIARPLLSHGTEEQRRRYLAPMLRSEEFWCQGFSEPNAGSDLAGLQTRARDDGDCFRITGQKVWTSYGQFARHCLLLARTSSDGPKQAGITAFIVDLKTPGITLRPIVQMTGDEEFCEVFYDDVVVPKGSVVGAVGQGWEIAMATVAYERGPVDIGFQAKFEVMAARLARQISATGLDDVTARRTLARAAVGVEVLRLRCLHSLAARATGTPPGPDTSVDKLLMAATEQRLLSAAMELLGTAELGGDLSWFDAYLYSRAASVYGGTAQIQKNILANRVLGLPTRRS
jgi:alkylation response protein AidB-like acyl-CoA dehydrogenase